MTRHLTLRLNGEATRAEVDDEDGVFRIRLGDRWRRVSFEPTGRPDLYTLLIDGESWEVFAQPRPGGWEVLIGTSVYSVDTGQSRPGRGAGTTGPDGAWTLRSPLAGIVVEVRVKPGDQVTKGQVLLVVESMKMNNELTAARAGRIVAVPVAAGARVERGAALVQIE